MARFSTNLLSVAVLLTLSTPIYAASYGGGSGTPEDPYQIRTPVQMNTIGANSGDWGAHFRLMADIEMSPYTSKYYNIIGNSTTAFTGSFEGNGYVIRNLTYSTSTTDGYVGLFGFAKNATFKNLGVENVAISSKNGSYVGGLVGYNFGGTLTVCYATGLVIGDGHVGGLVGYNSGGTLTACHATDWVGGYYDHVGGLVGYNSGGSLTACYATGSVGGYNNNVGGLVGYNSGGTLTACYATGSVGGAYNNIGGLIGYNSGGTLTVCYATGLVNGSGYVGGFAGWNNVGAIIACFWDIQASEQSRGVGYGSSTGLAGKTTEEMKTAATFTDVGWDFVGEAANGTSDIWRMCVDGEFYPHLAWEYSQGGDFTCPTGIDIDDLEFLAHRWMATTPDRAGSADGNIDGTVNIEDFAVLGSKWMARGSLFVMLSPLGAKDAGAMWRRMGTTPWLKGDTTENGIPVGTYTVEFKSVAEWNTPTNQVVTIHNNLQLNIVGSYTKALPEGLIAHWMMDDNLADKTVEDDSDNHLNGTAQQDTTVLTVTGKIASALTFNGTTDWIDCGTNAALLPEAWTVCAWVKCADTATPLLFSFGGNYSSIKLQNNSKGMPLIHLGQNNYRYFAASAWTTLKDGQWHHVAFSVPGKGQADIEQAQMYLDGVAVAGDTPFVTGPQASKSHVYLGANPSVTTQRFSGAMDEVMLFNRALTAGEVQRILNWTP